MPNRYLREDILGSERVDALSADGEVFYRRLMSKADDWGRFYGDWRMLRAALYPLRVEKITEKLIERLLVECSQVIDGRPLVRIYFCGGRRYLEITNFKQQIRSKSKFPDSTDMETASDRTCSQMLASDRICLQRQSDSISSSSSNSSSLEGSAEGNQPSQLEKAVEECATSIHGNHPAPRKDIGKGQVKTKLKEILRFKKLHAAAAVDYLGALADRHRRLCASDQWQKDSGEFAKGLNNWLAPTIERYEQEPPLPGTTRALSMAPREVPSGVCSQCGGNGEVLKPRFYGRPNSEWLDLPQEEAWERCPACALERKAS